MTPASAVRLLPDKVALVLGASRGIGEAIAVAAAAAGARVVVASRDLAALQALAARIDPGGETVLAARCDLADGASVEAAVAATVARFGRLDIAFNNGGYQTARTPFLDMTETMFDTSVAINLKGVFVAMQHEIRAMLGSGGGAIVNTSSALGTIAAPFVAPYVATKHGLNGLTKAAAVEFAPGGIRINAISPGPIMTEMLRLGPASSPEALQRMIGSVPAGRLGTVEEAASVAIWLASDAASYVTGAILPVDGGMVVP